MRSASGQDQDAATGPEQGQPHTPGTLWMVPGYSEGVYYCMQEPAPASGDESVLPELYALRRYDPEHPGGVLHEQSDDREWLQQECQERNRRSALADGFNQWWIADGQAKVVYPLETKASVYTSPAAESDEVSQPFQEMRAFKSARAVHDFLFLTRGVDEHAKAERLRELARELELTAEHLRELLELEQS